MPCLALGKPLPYSNPQTADFLLRGSLKVSAMTNLLYDSGQFCPLEKWCRKRSYLSAQNKRGAEVVEKQT